jgi:hypothetical protein
LFGLCHRTTLVIEVLLVTPGTWYRIPSVPFTGEIIREDGSQRSIRHLTEQ